jgi:lipopolysaccharide biosynthesis protein
MENFKRAVIFAGYTSNGFIKEDVICFLQELKKYSDYIIGLWDCEHIDNNELIKLQTIVNEIFVERHEEYDFGSYKRGYQFLLNNNRLEDFDQIVFCNDSIIFQNESLVDFFEKSKKQDFYGLTWHAHGFYPVTYQWDRLEHIQSFLICISKKIFSSDWFQDFIFSIKKENNKNEIIAKYEIGLSQLILKRGFTLESFYPKVDSWFEPCGYYLHADSNFGQKRLFLKRKPVRVNNL